MVMLENSIPAIMLDGQLKVRESLFTKGLIVRSHPLWGWRADLEAPASIRVAGVRRSPVEPNKQRFSVEKVATAHTPFSALWSRWKTPLDISDAGLMDGTLRGCQYHVVRITDSLEDINTEDA